MIVIVGMIGFAVAFAVAERSARRQKAKAADMSDLYGKQTIRAQRAEDRCAYLEGELSRSRELCAEADARAERWRKAHHALEQKASAARRKMKAAGRKTWAALVEAHGDEGARSIMGERAKGRHRKNGAAGGQAIAADMNSGAAKAAAQEET